MTLLFTLFWTLSVADSFRIYQDAVPVAATVECRILMPAAPGLHEYRVSAVQHGLESGLSVPVSLTFYDWTDGAYTTTDTLMQRGDDYLLLALPASRWAITWGETVTALCLYDYDLSGRVNLPDLAVFGSGPWTLSEFAQLGEMYQQESIRRSDE